ncbi:unnamed protein product [Nesidiocoris tenuis]|uniref:Uncharacterized protein n=1 Tax=Nesidiocoris tenuis TaxID=355587 RepID=A0A6H5H6B6_9HEMI|nr:unnamed protein product [Nesidiocoris tenuis]
MSIAWGNCCKEPIIKEASGLRGDLACRGVWEPQREALFDVRVVDTDAPSYVTRPVNVVLTAAEEEKKRKYVSACEQRHASFTPLVCSADAKFAPQMTAFQKVISERLADKWGRPHETVRGWVKVRLAFAILRATSMCIRGARKKMAKCGRHLRNGWSRTEDWLLRTRRNMTTLQNGLCHQKTNCTLKTSCNSRPKKKNDFVTHLYSYPIKFIADSNTYFHLLCKYGKRSKNVANGPRARDNLTGWRRSRCYPQLTPSPCLLAQERGSNVCDVTLGE